MSIPTIPVNNVQERVERSLMEAIRLRLVFHGYIPDTITLQPETTGNETAYEAALNAIVDAQGKKNSIEIFGNGSALSKGIETVPRIVLVTRRVMPGDIGKRIDGNWRVNPLAPDAMVKTNPPYESSNLHIDIEVVSNKARHDRIINAILAEAIGGTMGFINVWDSTSNERFFIKQFNFYDLPDVENGIIKKVYSYEIPDIYLTDGLVTPNYPTIKEITVQMFPIPAGTIVAADGTIIGPFQQDGKIFIDLSGISFQGN